MPRLALFDFDGTITTKDTLLDFHAFVFGRNRVWKTLLRISPALLRTKMAPEKTQEVKERFLSHFWKGQPHSLLQEWGNRYAIERLPRIIRAKALDVLCSHLARKDTVCIVTASVTEWVLPWCKMVGTDKILSSEMETIDGLLSGRLSRPNCKGPEKVRRIRESFDLSQWDKVVAYGDSAGDREMLDVAQIRYYRWKRLTDRL